MKKIIMVGLLVFILVSCGEKEEKIDEIKIDYNQEEKNNLESKEIRNGKKVYKEIINGEQKVILEDNGNKKIIYKSKKNKIIKNIINIGFLNDNLVYFTQNMWEGQISDFYNIDNGKILNFEKGDYEGVTDDKKFIYSCKSFDISKGHFLVYDMDFNLVKDINGNINRCYEYEKEKNSISYEIGNKKYTYNFSK